MSATRSDEYDKVIDAIHAEYSPKMKDVLDNVRSILVTEMGWWTGKTYDMDDEEYQWRFSAAPSEELQGDDPAIDVSLTLGEALVFGDEDRNPFGVSFRLDIVGYGGRIIGGFAPWNYTDQCWVDGSDAAAVADRWQLVEDADLSTIPDLVNQYAENNPYHAAKESR